MIRGAIRNVIVIVASAAGAFIAAWWFIENSPAKSIRDVLKEMWPVQGLLVGAILALIYRLSSDTTSVASLKAAQRHALDAMVTKKAFRLWALCLAVTIPAVLVRISDRFASPDIEPMLLGTAVFLAALSTLLCGYLPFIWNELRRFVTALVVAGEQDARAKAQLALLAAEKPKTTE